MWRELWRLFKVLLARNYCSHALPDRHLCQVELLDRRQQHVKVQRELFLHSQWASEGGHHHIPTGCCGQAKTALPVLTSPPRGVLGIHGVQRTVPAIVVALPLDAQTALENRNWFWGWVCHVVGLECWKEK